MTLIKADKADSRRFHYLQSGKTVPLSLAEQLLSERKILPNNDGIFPGFSQTYKLKKG